MNGLMRFSGQLKETFQSLPLPQKIFYAGAVLLVAAGLAFLVYSINRTEYTQLYSAMSESDMASVVEALKKTKTPYRLSAPGVISVPKDQLYEIRLNLANQGIPKGQSLGFEVFDQQKLGSTEFVQKVNYQRALQGELARTIRQMNEVMESRVHLVLPEESLFLGDQKPPSAAVVLKLHPGARLTQNQIQGVVHLVASSVKGLEESRVTILSTDGQVIFKKNENSDAIGMSGTHLELKSRVEEDLRQKVQSMLEQVVGSNHAVTRVTAELDFNQMQVEQDIYDPDSSVVRSQQRSIESSEGGEAGPKGNPDTPINVDSKLLDSGTSKDQQKKSSRQRETVNYEINRISRKTIQSPGTIKKLSVAVLVDGPYTMKADADGREKPTFAGRSPEELKALEDIVKKAVGYDESRGDQVSVSNIPFVADYGAFEEPKGKERWMDLLKNNQKLLLNVLLTICIFFFLVRPFMKKFQKMDSEPQKLPQQASQAALPPGTADQDPLAALLGPEEQRESALTSFRERAVSLIKQEPEKATDIIRSWLREGNR